ncbi:N-acetylmuramoyl-L-alanine amidase [Methylomonas rosea]|uniref:N-acetylmuramoyl-L-alanine amidase n=1 Tax=Methylomonas rosea TaxID=2952227 RepID=A0ABT1TPA1_9GAMM|nr:N-acetylmuramoyl-L-alanine amidase [Methylomonas sp. WSC-7]MCQ8116593.1 N-acetylmuramoyl-L-alanine amidase [Methylomonas sp. WSC-7]
MDKQWIGCAQGNFRAGRPAGFKPDIIVLHSADGSLAEASMRYNKPGALQSMHYAIGNNGEIYQYVQEADTAFHAGLVVNPSAGFIKQRPNTNPNFFSIGIALEEPVIGSSKATQLAACSKLIREIADRWRINVDADHVLSHSAIRASVNCPGSSIDIANLIAAALPDPAVNSVAGKQVGLLSRANLRSRPSVSAPVVQVMEANSKVEIVSFTVGDVVSGNGFWYQDKDGCFFWAGATDRPNPQVLAMPKESEASTDTMVLGDRPAAVVTGLTINHSRFRLPAGQFFTETPKKDLIVLHFTAGSSAKSAFDTWIGDAQHVAAAYLIDVDGAVYEVFDPTQWAYHLGVKGFNGRLDQRSIAIEIANVGPLRPAADNPEVLNWWPPRRGQTQPFGSKYCDKTQIDKYMQTSYRGEQYFATFPAQQVQAIRLLLNDLCGRFAIPKTLPPKPKQFERDLAFFQHYSGIASHVNFRTDKWDIGPAFDWAALGIANAHGT